MRPRPLGTLDSLPLLTARHADAVRIAAASIHSMGVGWSRLERARRARRRLKMAGLWLISFPVMLIVTLVACWHLNTLVKPVGIVPIVMAAALIPLSTVGRVQARRRTAARLAPFLRRRFAAARSPESDGSESAIAVRRDAWRQKLAERSWWISPPIDPLIVDAAAGFLVICALAVPLYFRLPTSVGAMVFPIGVMAFAVLIRRERRAFLARLRAALSGEACAECGYVLAGAPPHRPEAPWLGPRVCPECGSRWPLVPPPLIEELAVPAPPPAAPAPRRQSP